MIRCNNLPVVVMVINTSNLTDVSAPSELLKTLVFCNTILTNFGIPEKFYEERSYI